MENRRQHFRHYFSPMRPIAVRLQSAEGTAPVEGDPEMGCNALASNTHTHMPGDLVDLSIGGMCVYAAALKGDRSPSWVVTLTLESTPPLCLRVERVHKRVADGSCCGFRFLDDEDVIVLEEREKAIWKFLLDEQRRRRRYLRGE